MKYLIETYKFKIKLYLKMQANNDDADEAFMCPILFTIMKDPVNYADGYTYERSAIEEHLKKDPTSPFTREPMEPGSGFPNRNLKAQIEAYLEA